MDQSMTSSDFSRQWCLSRLNIAKVLPLKTAPPQSAAWKQSKPACEAHLHLHAPCTREAQRLVRSGFTG